MKEFASQDIAVLEPTTVAQKGLVENSLASQIDTWTYPEPKGYLFIKRVADIFVSIALLVFAVPTMMVFAIMIYFQDRGPVVYKQSRVGRFGVPFTFYKLRSMYLDADARREELLKHSDTQGAAFKMKKDPRITPVGRWIRKLSIDEAPQIFLVLTGRMSIIGPRPHLQSEVDQYRPDQRPRLFIKPGLLCYREIRGRSHLSFEQWVQSDLEYIANRSLWVDLKIFLLAIPAVIKGSGAF